MRRWAFFFVVLAAALLCASPGEAHQTLLGELYRRQHASLPDVTVKHDLYTRQHALLPDVTVKHERLHAKLLHLNRTAFFEPPPPPRNLHRARNHTEAPPDSDMVDGLMRIFRHVIDPFYDFMKSLTDTVQEPPQAVRAQGSTSIPNLLF